MLHKLPGLVSIKESKKEPWRASFLGIAGVLGVVVAFLLLSFFKASLFFVLLSSEAEAIILLAARLS